MASLHVPIVEVVQGARVVSDCTEYIHVRNYIYDSLGRGRVYAEKEIVYGKFTNKNYNSMRLPSVLVMASACTLGPCQCIPGPVFRPRNL